MCLYTYEVLYKNNIHSNILISELKFSRDKEDHVHIRLDYIIIDPTYKQFLVIKCNHIFNTILHDYYSPFFIGTYKELFSLYEMFFLGAYQKGFWATGMD